MTTLKFSENNGKLTEAARELKSIGMIKYIKNVVVFDLPAGHTCPAAKECMVKADKITGELIKGKHNRYDCYAAKAERQYDLCRNNRWNNYDNIKNCNSIDEIVELINSSIPNGTEIIRIHSSGDFFSKNYFLAWVEIAKINPNIKIIGYTKMLQYVNYDKPDNFSLIYSMGGKYDKKVNNSPFCEVVQTIDEAYTKGLQVSCLDNNHDDLLHIMTGQSFALLVH
jgi:hypothetical protein